MVEPTGEQTAGIEFELLRTYPLSVAMTAAHPFARLKSIPLEKLAAEPFIVSDARTTPSITTSSTASSPRSAQTTHRSGM